MLTPSMPFFSVVIPVYNRADLIGQTIDSILAQEFTDFEIIAVDDGSADATLQILSQYGTRVTTLQQPNQGPGAARNLGISRAIGRYIAFLDSDDLFFPWTLKTYRQLIESNRNPSFIAGKPLLFKNTSELISAQEAPPLANAFDDYLASGDQWRWFGVSSFVIRRDVLASTTGFAKQAVNCEDADLAMKLGTAPGFLQVTSPPTFGYREHLGNITHNSQKSFQGLKLLLDSEQSGRYPGGDDRRKQRQTLITMHARPLSIQCLRLGNTSLSWSLYRRTFRWHLGQGRLRYLAGFPLLALTGKFNRGSPKE